MILSSQYKASPQDQRSAGRVSLTIERMYAPFRHRQISPLNFIRLVLACKEDPGSFLDEVIKCAFKIQAKQFPKIFAFIAIQMRLA